MTTFKKTKKTFNDVNLVKQNQTYIYITRKAIATSIVTSWKNKQEIQWTKYQIKETDMRVKTASFTTTQYLDLTTGQFNVLITSPYHEDFGGVVMSVEYDSKDGLYTYQCQDFSRVYQSKTEVITSNATIHRVLQYLITRGDVPLTGKVKKQVKRNKKALSGLRPASQYSGAKWGNIVNINPMTQKRKMIIRSKSYIEAIRDVVFGIGMFIDVYFDKYGVIHIEPFVKDDWLHTGLQITTPEIANAKHKFDTTNIITGTLVHNTNKTKSGKYYSSESLIGLDLSLFFGDLRASIDNPNTSNNTAKATKKTDVTQIKDGNIYGTKQKNVFLNSDDIDDYSTDMGRLEEMKRLLEKEGWNVTIAGVGSESHYERRGEVKEGIWFCIYGGFCAGTLREHCDNDWFLNPLKSNKSRVVVGFFPPATCGFRKGCQYYEHLGPAWDWQGNRDYANIDYPGKALSGWGIPWMFADNPKEMVAKFLAGGDNFKTEGSSYNDYDSWQKHKPSWL